MTWEEEVIYNLETINTSIQQQITDQATQITDLKSTITIIIVLFTIYLIYSMTQIKE